MIDEKNLELIDSFYIMFNEFKDFGEDLVDLKDKTKLKNIVKNYVRDCFNYQLNEEELNNIVIGVNNNGQCLDIENLPNKLKLIITNIFK